MKTYSRRRAKMHKEIQDIQKLCRLCLNKPKESVQIYTGTNNNICAALALRIMICVGLEVSWNDCLPNIVCTECCKELERCYIFRKRCEATYLKLKSHVQAVRQTCDEESNKLSATTSETEWSESVNNDVDQFLWPHQEDTFLEETKENDLIKRNEEVSSEITDKENMTQVELNMDPPVEANFETFLSNILMQLRVVTSFNNKLTLLNQNVRTLEIETANGKFLVELMEEDQQINEADMSYSNCEGNKLIEQHESQDNLKISVEAKTAEEDGCLKCDECGKRFKSRGPLARHRRLRCGERPHACSVCGRRFAQRAVMLRHELVHNVRRAHQCPHCPKSYTYRKGLEAHARSHSALQQRRLNLYRCRLCPKFFLHASGLSRHKQRHNGRVYKCGACARHFNDQSSMLRHLRNTDHGPV